LLDLINMCAQDVHRHGEEAAGAQELRSAPLVGESLYTLAEIPTETIAVTTIDQQFSTEPIAIVLCSSQLTAGSRKRPAA
jgi:hypothetical protein